MEPQRPGNSGTTGTVRCDPSFINPKVIDLDGQTAINPRYFAKVKADYPALKSTG